MFFFGPKKCKHDLRTVAFDSSFHTIYSDTKNKRNYHVKWFKCKHCGERSFDRGGAERHSGIEQVRNRWLEQDRITLTSEGEVYDENYQIVNNPGPNQWAEYRLNPVTDVDRLLRMLADSPEFQELLKHQMVADAFGELETVVRMHENV